MRCWHVVDQLAVRQHNQPLYVSLRQNQLMSDDYDGHPERLVEFADQIHNLGAGA
jgi:hypothetical protein